MKQKCIFIASHLLVSQSIFSQFNFEEIPNPGISMLQALPYVNCNEENGIDEEMDKYLLGIGLI